MRAVLRRRGADERGATLVLMSMALVALLGVAGLVVDFGLVRTDRQQNKSAADLAVAAGMRALELGGYPAPFRGACEAVKYLQANHSELADLTGTYADGHGVATSPSDPCSPSAPQWKQLCVPHTKSTWAWYRGSAQGGRIVVDVKTGYELSDGGFADEALIGADAGDPELGNCDHLAVVVTETQTPGLGKVVFTGNLSSKIRSVGRVTQSIDTTAVISLLLLEQVDCDVVTFNGSNSAVRVLGFETRSGIVHADSIGTGDNCNNQILNSTQASTGPPDNYVGPALVADRAPLANADGDREPGHMSVTAKSGVPGADPSKAATACPSTVWAVPGDGSSTGTCVEGSSRKGRINVDLLFRARIAALRADAAGRVAWSQAQAEAAGYAYFNSCPSGVVPDRYVFIDGTCNNKDVSFTHDEAEVVIDGSLSGGNVVFTSPALVVVGNGMSQSSGGSLLSVNAGPSADCTARASTPSGRAQSAKLVVVNGSLKSTGGTLRLCQTTVLLGDGNSSGSDCGLPAIPTTNGVPPYDNCFDGNVELAGGAAVDWTAPNATDNPMDWDESADQPYLDDFEDLAFWTETQSGNGLSGGGSNVMKGVFFLPNADPFTISGGASQAIERDAQFIVRKLSMNGNGFLTMRPNPKDAVKFPYFSGFTMVR